MAELDSNAVSIVGLMLSVRSLGLMVARGLVPSDEAQDMVREVFKDIGKMDRGLQEQARPVIATVFPSVDLDARPARERSSKFQ